MRLFHRLDQAIMVLLGALYLIAGAVALVVRIVQDEWPRFMAYSGPSEMCATLYITTACVGAVSIIAAIAVRYHWKAVLDAFVPTITGFAVIIVWLALTTGQGLKEVVAVLCLTLVSWSARRKIIVSERAETRERLLPNGSSSEPDKSYDKK